MGMFSHISPNYPQYAPETTIKADGFKDLDSWNCSEWRQYYENAKEGLGQKDAVKAIEGESQRVGMFADVHSCKYDCPWNQYMRNEGFEIGWLASDVWCGAQNVGDVIYSGGEAVGNVGDTIAAFTNTKFLISAVVVGGIIYWAQTQGTK